MPSAKVFRFLKSALLLLACATQPSASLAQSLPRMQTPPPEAHYRVYDATGKPTDFKAIADALGRAEVVFIGETHNDSLAHMLEAELLRTAFQRFAGADKNSRRAVALALEMFERDVQVVVDEYLAGLITERHFLASSRPWNNYETDYRPLVEFAREHQLAIIAANAPARYVTRVSRSGVESLRALSEAARSWLPPLPFAPASQTYAGKFAQFMGGEPARTQSPNPHQAGVAAPAQPTPPQASPSTTHSATAAAHGASNLLDAQNLRDATMAYAVSEHLKRTPGAFVLHVNGRFHSEGRLGVPEHLLRYRPATRILVVTILSSQSFPDFEAATMAGSGDFVIITDPRLPRSF